MAKSVEKVPSTYSTLVQRLASTSTNYKALNEFLKASDHASQSPTKFTVADFPPGLSASPSIQFEDFDGTARLAQVLDQKEPKAPCRLFIVENICAQTIILLGEKFDIDPQFFVDHLNMSLGTALPVLQIESRLSHQLKNCTTFFNCGILNQENSRTIRIYFTAVSHLSCRKRMRT
ncbi:hypothetical protein NA56DRAFT_74532 [Hyaloscypha hepaticicola]|uniref:Uncharacterized protein n=1 Tax=Hyaloscypha hepaticicola TaxID=2082293 RepID=A0A2J6Q924_9HELO|nr:hypothetical protein NA56DRAFT_74532 [Hyaloscypha hepaticicola]